MSHILAVLSSSDLVIEVKVIAMTVEPKTQSLRAKATLKKGYELYVNEGVSEKLSEKKKRGIDFEPIKLKNTVSHPPKPSGTK